MRGCRRQREGSWGPELERRRGQRGRKPGSFPRAESAQGPAACNYLQKTALQTGQSESQRLQSGPAASDEEEKEGGKKVTRVQQVSDSAPCLPSFVSCFSYESV